VQYTGVVDQDINPAIGLAGFINRPLDLSRAGYITMDVHSPRAGLLQHADERKAFLIVDIQNDGSRPFSAEFLGDGTANSAGSTGNDRNFSIK
jgi:hypothetical protein